MANKQAALKYIRQTEKRTIRNRRVRTEIKTFIKKFDEAKASEDKEATQAIARKLVSIMDKAAKRSIIHPNLARRYKERCAPYVA